jgi:ribosomal-protein-serine acetyltransferase
MKIERPITNTITLRPYTEADAESLFNVIHANYDYLMEWFPWPAWHKTIEDSAAYIAKLTYDDPYGHFGLGIFDDGEVIGSVGLVRGEAINEKSEIGYWLAEGRQGEGIVTKSVTATLALAFNTFGMHRVTIRSYATNKPSIAIPERLGFHFEGVERDALLQGGERHSLRLYSMLSHEFNTDQTGPT